MRRAKVIVHMYTSIDGKIDGNHGGGESAAYYSDELFRLSNADANGRRTIQMYAAPGKLALGQFKGTDVDYSDWLPQIQSNTWAVAFDRKGVDGWQTDYFDYGGHRMHAIEVVTKQASREYLAFLRSMKIPYIVSGETEFDLNAVLVKLKEHFGIERMALCGGARINGAFLTAGLVDQISLVISPVVNGDNAIKASFDTAGQEVKDEFAISQIKKLSDGGVHLIFDKKN